MRVLRFKTRFLYLLIPLHFGITFQAEAGPKRMSWLLPSGILFPAFHEAAGVNPSVISLERSRGVRLSHTPALADSIPSKSALDFATANRKAGLGLGLARTLSEGMPRVEAMGAVALHIGDISLGVMAQQDDLERGSKLNSVLALAYVPRKTVNATVVYRNEEEVRLAVGYASRYRFSVEANATFYRTNREEKPKFGIAGSKYWQDYGVSYGFQMDTKHSTFSHTLAAGYWISERVSASLAYSSPSNATLGVTVIF
jgi:hypothetical protein